MTIHDIGLVAVILWVAWAAGSLIRLFISLEKLERACGNAALACKDYLREKDSTAITSGPGVERWSYVEAEVKPGVHIGMTIPIVDPDTKKAEIWSETFPQGPVETYNVSATTPIEPNEWRGISLN